MQEPERPPPADDLARLRTAHPLWDITAIWISASSGPDFRILAATRQGIQVSAWDEAELGVKIADEERARTWPAS